MAADINTGIADLTTAVTALTLQASTFDATFNLRIGQLVSAINNIPPGCECPTMGTGTPIGDVIEEDPPPEGYGTWDPGIDDRKCKLANMVYDDIYSVTQSLYDNDVQEVAGVGIGSLTALLGLIAAMLISGPLAWGLAALGAIAGVIAFFLLQTVDLFQLLVIMTTKRTELVCALYNATSSQGALDDFQTVLLDGGASVTMLAYLDALQMLNGLVVLFFEPEGAMGEEINARLDGYPMAIDCVACLVLGPFDWKITNSGFWGATSAEGTLGTGVVENDGTQFSINTVVNTAEGPSHNIIALIVNAHETGGMLCVGYAGQFQIVTDPGGAFSNNAARCIGAGQCGNPHSLVGMGGPGVYDSYFLFFRQWATPQSMTFAIPTPPTPC